MVSFQGMGRRETLRTRFFFIVQYSATDTEKKKQRNKKTNKVLRAAERCADRTLGKEEAKRLVTNSNDCVTERWRPIYLEELD